MIKRPFPIPFIVGPTASGKSSLAVNLGLQLPIEIISVDARQVYTELNAGTAKPCANDLSKVPHHLISERSARQPIEANAYAQWVYTKVEQILGRGHLPILVGGSTLYSHAIEVGLSKLADVPTAMVTQLSQELAEVGRDTLYSELQRVDLEAARTMDATKTQRLIRALAYFRAHERPISIDRAIRVPPPFAFAIFLVSRDRDELYQRIDERVPDMVAAGLVEEAHKLRAVGIDASQNPIRTIGYFEALQMMDNGKNEAWLIEQIQRNTRHYAKRQLTWFKARTHYVPVHPARATPLIDYVSTCTSKVSTAL